jgi:hypothetical protein
VAQENHTLTFAALSAEQKQAVHEDAEEHYISYAFLHQSGAQHGNLKVDLRNDFTTGSNRYPKTHQHQTPHLLNKYSKTVVMPKTTSSEGSSFTQKGGRGGRGGKGRGTITFDKEYWKDKTCFNCGEKGHPSSSCTKVAITNEDDSASIVQSVKKLAKDTKNLKKAFTQLQKTSEQDSDLSGSESEEEDSHFQLGDGFQFTQMKVKQTAIELELQIAKLFKQTHGTKIKLNLKKVILLDSQSTMDLICDPALVVELTFKSSHSMRLKSNGGTMEVKKQAIMPGYHAHVWYNKKQLPTFSL